MARARAATDRSPRRRKQPTTEALAGLNLDFSDTFTGVAGVFDVSAHFQNGAVVDVDCTICSQSVAAVVGDKTVVHHHFRG